MIVLKPEETIQFTTDQGEATISHHPELEIEAGDIVVANPEQQYLVEVREVTRRQTGQTQVILRQARVADLVGDGTGSLNVESTPVYDLEDIDRLNRIAQQQASGEAIYKTDEQGKITIRNLELFSVDLNSEGHITGGANRILGIPVQNFSQRFTVSSGVGGKYSAKVNEAIIEVIPTMRSDAQWQGGKISNLQTRLDAKVHYRVDLTYEAAGQIKLEGIYDLLPKKIIPVRIPGPPPIYLDIELSLPGGVSLEATHNGQTRVIYEAEYDFYTTMTYDSETGIGTDQDQRTLVKDTRIETSQSDTKLNAEIFLRPQVTARFYRVVGPYMYLKPYVRGEVQWPQAERKDDLFVGVTGGVGIELSEPIFVTSLVNYDSGKLFDFYTSFDLDQRGTDPAAPVSLDPNVQTTVNVNELGPEGFVRINLKEHLEEGFLRYELLQSTQTGLMVPSETFYMDGELFYYPMPNSQGEQFSVRIYGANNSSKDVTIAVNIGENVRAQVSQERYGITTNSFRVAMGTPGEFRDQVPNHNLGGTGVVAAVSPEEEESHQEHNGIVTARPDTPEQVRSCMEQFDPFDRNRQERAFRGDCSFFAPSAMKFVDFIEEILNPEVMQSLMQHQHADTSALTHIEEIATPGEGDYARYNFFNLADFRHFSMKDRPEVFGCTPALSIEKTVEADLAGIRITNRGCPPILIPISFNTLFLNSTEGPDYFNFVENTTASHSLSLNLQTSKYDFVHESEQEKATTKSLYIILPLNPSIQQIYISDSLDAIDQRMRNTNPFLVSLGHGHELSLLPDISRRYIKVDLVFYWSYSVENVRMEMSHYVETLLPPGKTL